MLLRVRIPTRFLIRGEVVFFTKRKVYYIFKKREMMSNLDITCVVRLPFSARSVMNSYYELYIITRLYIFEII